MPIMSPNVPHMRIHTANFQNFTPEESLLQQGKIPTKETDKGQRVRLPTDFIKLDPSAVFKIYGGYAFHKVPFNLHSMFPANDYRSSGRNTYTTLGQGP